MRSNKEVQLESIIRKAFTEGFFQALNGDNDEEWEAHNMNLEELITDMETIMRCSYDK